MAAKQLKIRGSAPKVRNRNRTPGYWVTLARSRDGRNRVLAQRSARQGINFPDLSHVGSAAYRRRLAR